MPEDFPGVCGVGLCGVGFDERGIKEEIGSGLTRLTA
jgi:hypothetical protein